MARVSTPPEGFKYRPELLSIEEERDLIELLAELPLRNFEFHGYLGKRRTLSFGWRYDFSGGGLQKAETIPAFLLRLRDRAAILAGRTAVELDHVLVTEYPPGAGLGWHKDKAVFAEVIGVSLLGACTLRFRRGTPDGWHRWSITAEPRSAYLLTGPARSAWEHSIPAVRSLRYSITFRSLASGGGDART